jgi:putative nucleotidyltransferase with HDIG domain
MKDIKVILNKVEVLPPSPSLLPKLLPHLGDVNANFDEVVKLIALDQTLTAKLLQICNSAFFGQEEPIATVDEAVSRVGYQSVYLLTAMINGSGSFPATPTGSVDATRLWKHSVAAAFCAKFAAEASKQDANLALTAGLMHDIGKLILAQISAPLNGFNFHLPTSIGSLAGEKTAYECNHAETGGMLLEKWNLPPALVAAVRHHHNPGDAGEHQKLAACVCIGNFVTHNLEYARHTENAEFAAALKILQLDAGQLKHWHAQFKESAELISSMSKLPA